MGLLEDRERQREHSQRRLYMLNEGWPFGDGPFQWPLHLEHREGQIHLVGDCCNQAIWCMSTEATGRGFTWNLELLKARVADHVLKVHPEAATT